MSKENAILADMQKEIWVMEPRHLNALFTRLIEFEIKVPAGVEVITNNKLSIIGDTAIIKISGVLLKNIPSLYRWLGIEMTSYLDIQKQLAEAIGNQEVKKILLDIDSPGGVVSSVMETSQAIADAAVQKQVTARIDDLGASGAYWLASQASKIIAGPNAEVGAIGVFTVYVDSQARAEKEGFTVHIVRSGEHKGMGVPGAKITTEQLNAVQQIIDGMADNFIKAVSSGRKMSIDAVRELADGRTFLAANAQKAGLIDDIMTNKKSKSKENNMGQEQNVEKNTTGNQQSATGDIETVKKQASEEGKQRLAALKAAFPNEYQFVITQFEAGATVEQAKAAFCDVLAKRLEKAESEKEEMKKKAGKGGAPPLKAGGEGGSQASEFIETALQYASEHKCSKTEALKKVRKSNPELFEEYLSNARENRVTDKE